MNTKQKQVASEVKAQVATAIRRAMSRQNLTQTEVARRMGTSRAVLHRLISVDEDLSVTVRTIARAAEAVGCQVRVRLVAM